MAASDAGSELHVAWKPDPFILDCGDASNLGAPEETLINLFASESRLTALSLPRAELVFHGCAGAGLCGPTVRSFESGCVCVVCLL